MSLSLGEIETTAKKATRGAGYPWGLAEEAAFATRWLSAQGLDGCAILSGFLQAGFAQNLPQHTPTSLGQDWRAPDALCPILTGAAISDRAARLAVQPITLHNVAHPMLLLPFVARAATLLQRPLSLQCGALTIAAAGAALGRAAPLPALAATLTISLGGTISERRSTTLRARPDPEAWQALMALAQLTYAPATDASRRLGAGTGQTDND